MFNLFKKKPKCNDVAYVFNVYECLKYSYDKKKYKIINFDIDIVDYKSFIMMIECYSEVLGIQFNISNIEETDETIFGLPIVFDASEVEENNNLILSIYLTPFGLENLNVAFCEILLLFIDIKITRDDIIRFEDDFLNNLEEKYRPFLVLAATYFGVGLPLLKRLWITGRYSFKNYDIDNFTFKYNIPIDINFFLFAHVLFCNKDNNNKMIFMEYISELNSELKKEIRRCLNYVQDLDDFKFSNVNTFGFTWEKLEDINHSVLIKTEFTTV